MYILHDTSISILQSQFITVEANNTGPVRVRLLIRCPPPSFALAGVTVQNFIPDFVMLGTSMAVRQTGAVLTRLQQVTQDAHFDLLIISEKFL